MKTCQKGFISPLLLALVAILLIGGGAYVYVQNKRVPVTQPHIDSVVPLSVSIGSFVTIYGTNFNPLGSYVGSSQVFITLKNINSGQEGIIDEDSSQGSGQRFFQDHIQVEVATVMCAASTMAQCPKDKLFVVTPGEYLLGVSVNGRGTSNTVPITISEASSTAQTSNSQSANWETYINSQYGFQLDYISGTKLPDHMYGPNDNAIRFQPVGAKENAPGSFVINVMSGGSGSCSSQTKAGQSTPFTHVTINGIDFTKYDIFVDINNTHWIEYCTIKNGSEYLIGFVPPANTDVTADPVLSRVISSFQFKTTRATETTFSVSPMSGKAPLTVTTVSFDGCNSELTWGDNSDPWLSGYAMQSCGGEITHPMVSKTHTYTTPGTYTISLYSDPPPASPVSLVTVTVTK